MDVDQVLNFNKIGKALAIGDVDAGNVRSCLAIDMGYPLS